MASPESIKCSLCQTKCTCPSLQKRTLQNPSGKSVQPQNQGTRKQKPHENRDNQLTKDSIHDDVKKEHRPREPTESSVTELAGYLDEMYLPRSSVSADAALMADLMYM